MSDILTPEQLAEINTRNDANNGLPWLDGCDLLRSHAALQAENEMLKTGEWSLGMFESIQAERDALAARVAAVRELLIRWREHIATLEQEAHERKWVAGESDKYQAQADLVRSYVHEMQAILDAAPGGKAK